MIDLFMMNNDQVIDWLLDQAGLEHNASLECNRDTGKLTKITVEDAQVEVEIDERGVVVVRQKGQEVLRTPTWTVLDSPQ